MNTANRREEDRGPNKAKYVGSVGRGVDRGHLSRSGLARPELAFPSRRKRKSPPLSCLQSHQTPHLPFCSLSGVYQGWTESHQLSAGRSWLYWSLQKSGHQLYHTQSWFFRPPIYLSIPILDSNSRALLKQHIACGLGSGYKALVQTLGLSAHTTTKPLRRKCKTLLIIDAKSTRTGRHIAKGIFKNPSAI